MTREEAIKLMIVERQCVVECEDDYSGEIIKAYDMAIVALNEVQKHEETFEWCHDCKEYDTENCCCHRWSKVIRNTVEELKEEPPTIPGFTESAEAYKAWTGEEMGKTSDLIRKEDVIKAFENKIMITGTDDAYKFGAYVQGVMDKINELPTVSADRPHGEWIKRGTKITCSHCKSAWSASFDTIIVGMKYCPNCGADMRGGDGE